MFSQKTIKVFNTKAHKTKHVLPYDSAFMLLGIYPDEMRICVPLKTCTQMFMADLFPVAKTWKQPSRPSVGERKTVIPPDSGTLFSSKQQ